MLVHLRDQLHHGTNMWEDRQNDLEGMVDLDPAAL